MGFGRWRSSVSGGRRITRVPLEVLAQAVDGLVERRRLTAGTCPSLGLPTANGAYHLSCQTHHYEPDPRCQPDGIPTLLGTQLTLLVFRLMKSIRMYCPSVIVLVK